MLTLCRLLTCFFTAVAVLTYRQIRSADIRRRRRSSDHETASYKTGQTSNPYLIPQRDPELLELKEIYYKLHNLEKFSEIRPRCRDLLVSLFSETLTEAFKEQSLSILSIAEYSFVELRNFLDASHTSTTNKYEKYIRRRRSGGPREMFGSVDAAEWWLKQAAPVKYVDGAWLGHINKIYTPFCLRSITKNAWQVMSEELGDGDLRKNHIHVYRQLLQHIDAGLPEADAADFIHPRHGLDDKGVWKAAVAQLLISLFPQDFLPEALGFNMAYECLPLHLLKTVKELDELGIPSYYFVLHISIDNNDSGHAAMAMQAVVDYLAHARAQGDDAVEEAWRRVQAGFVLAEGLPTIPGLTDSKKPVHFDHQEEEVVQIFKRKCSAHKIHCNSNIKFGPRTLVDWLDPHDFQRPEWQREFLDALSNRRPWIVRGNGAKSKLIHELSWGGRMFGAFTENEVAVVQAWIDGLNHSQQNRSQPYHDFIRSRPTDRKNPSDVDHTLVITDEYQNLESLLATTIASQTPLEAPKFNLASADLSRLMPLWYTSTCLLECIPSVPVRASNPTGSAIVRILRSQYGFLADGNGVAGMAELHRTNDGQSVGLVELGLEMSTSGGLRRPRHLAETIDQSHYSVRTFATWMLEISMRPIEYQDVLLGLTFAFVGLHKSVSNETKWLSSDSLRVLEDIVQREEENVRSYMDEIKLDHKRLGAFSFGLERGTDGIRTALEPQLEDP